MQKIPLELNAHELNASGVIKIIEFFDKELLALRIKNDVSGANAEYLRGAISQVKRFQQKLLKGNKTDG